MKVRAYLTAALALLWVGFAWAQGSPYSAKILSPANGSCAGDYVLVKFHASGPTPFTATLNDDMGNVFYTEGFGGQPPDITVPYQPLVYEAPDGLHTLTLTVSGSAGPPATATVTILVDFTPPTAAVTGPQDGACLNHTVTITGSVVDVTSGPGAWSMWIDGSMAAQGSGTPVSVSWDTTLVPDGSLHTIQLKASDLCGNSSASPVVTVKVDNTAPYVAGVTPPAGSTLNGVATVTGTIANGESAEWSVTVDGSTAGITPTSGTGSTIQFTWDTRQYTDGPHKVQVMLSDNCGNMNASYLSFNVHNLTGGSALPLKNLIVGTPGASPASPGIRLFRPQTVFLDDITVRDVLKANGVQINGNLIVQAVWMAKYTPSYKCLGLVYGPGTGLNVNFASGWVYANNTLLDIPVEEIVFGEKNKLGMRSLLFSPPGTEYTLKVEYVTRNARGRTSKPITVEMNWQIVIENRDDLRANIEYFSTIAAGATQKPKIADDVEAALYQALTPADDLDALIQFEAVVASVVTDFSVLRDLPDARFAFGYLIDDVEEPIGCLLIEQANALLWH